LLLHRKLSAFAESGYAHLKKWPELFSITKRRDCRYVQNPRIANVDEKMFPESLRNGCSGDTKYSKYL
jgi:hypothetical protein